MDFTACLRAGGLLLIQNRNFDAVMATCDRWMEPQSYTDGDTQWSFQRFYDFDTDGLITFNMVTLKKEGQGAWKQTVSTSRLRPVLRDELVADLEATGFSDIQLYGSMSGESFDPGASTNLVVSAIKIPPETH
jgi:hypothetical protein